MKLKFLAVAILLVFAGNVFAQEGEMTVIDEVIAQVNDDVITLSMLKRESRERIEALPPHSNLHRPLIDDFVAAIIDDRAPSVDGGAGRAVSAALAEIYR